MEGGSSTHIDALCGALVAIEGPLVHSLEHIRGEVHRLDDVLVGLVDVQEEGATRNTLRTHDFGGGGGRAIRPEGVVVDTIFLANGLEKTMS